MRHLRHCASTARSRRSTRTLATMAWERAHVGRWQKHCASTLSTLTSLNFRGNDDL
ncbi:MAG: hypothetical protein ACK56F_14255 [bacterium]